MAQPKAVQGRRMMDRDRSDMAMESTGDAVLVFEPVLARAARFAERPALADVSRQYSYGQLGCAIEQRATVLRSLGIAPGDRVVLASDNSAEQLATHFAILRTGAVSVPLPGSTPVDRLDFIARDCTARMICVDTRALAGARAGGERTILSLADLSRRGEEARQLAEPAGRTPDDIACLMYTTGSTGDPKAVILTHRSLGSALSHIIDYLGCSAADREAIVLPLSHSFGLGHAYCTLWCGGFVWVNDGLRPLKAVLDALTRFEINAMPTTPSMLRLLLGPYRQAFLRNAGGLRRMVVNSERLPPDQAAEVLAALPGTDIVIYYGLTEASRSTFLRLRDEPAERHGTVGRAAPRVEIGICDASGAPLPSGSEGEVRIRGPHLAVGYWQRPDEQAAAFRDGWLHSGDLGTLDSEGYLTITGRLKDQINVGGFKVSAKEVEDVLRRYARIADVAVTGISDPQGLRGEAVAVAVVGHDRDLTAEEVAAFCADHLDAAAQPQRIAMVDAIPRAESGKVLKGDVQRLFQSGDGWTRA
ncbi:MAG: acyl--CoA ligase [Enhydrobacter sp.]|nr:MAG: acyl--CoA ligase [Enhydrobacter sp.]